MFRSRPYTTNDSKILTFGLLVSTQWETYQDSLSQTRREAGCLQPGVYYTHGYYNLDQDTLTWFNGFRHHIHFGIDRLCLRLGLTI